MLEIISLSWSRIIDAIQLQGSGKKLEYSDIK